MTLKDVVRGFKGYKLNENSGNHPDYRFENIILKY
jgi:hypothetical protein